MAFRILVVGAGAVGGYFGARLVQAGQDVTFLVRAARASEIAERGLQIVSPHGDATLYPKTLIADHLTSPFDVIFLSVKGYALEAAMDDFAPAVTPETMILPVLNGLRHIDSLAARFGEKNVLGGVCLIVSQQEKDGRIVQLTDLQQLTYGERSGEVTERIRQLDAAMQEASFDAKLSENIVHAMWEKWVQLASLGAATCLFRGNIGEIQSIQGGAELSLRVLEECCAVATAAGNPPSDAFLARVRQAMTTPGSTLTSSMYRDLTQGRNVEVDQILGDLLARGRTFGIPTPLLTAAFVNLSIYRSRLAAK